SNAHRDYELRLNQALQEAPDSKKLLVLQREWENGEYEDDWERYKDFKNDIKVNKQRNATSDNDREGNNSNISQEKTESTTVNNNELALQVASRITTLKMNNELEAYAKETIRDDGKRWTVCETDIRDVLTKWKQEKA
ncbi:8248_t:CDS:2, partial [Racocetra fulgida]